MASASAERMFFAVQNWWLSVWSNSVVEQASKGLWAAVRQIAMDEHPLCMLEYSVCRWSFSWSDGWLLLALFVAVRSPVGSSLAPHAPPSQLHPCAGRRQEAALKV